MTVRAKNRVTVAGILVSIVALAATLLPMVASSDQPAVRDIRIVVRDMSFYVEGSTQPNPTITLRAGEKVRIRLRNDDAGMRHDFAIKAWTVATRVLVDRGQEDEIVFRVPTERSAQTYQCTPHAGMMSGEIRVE
ncbi:MAG TPA: plastocyanin/azurin family copper-binding protein [Vicinamibacterales bacterium]|nr:plastocyanin/azurin family copper-binding protein [Vicinamibacterales bacterium]